jgi:hypothetical protein
MQIGGSGGSWMRQLSSGVGVGSGGGVGAAVGAAVGRGVGACVGRGVGARVGRGVGAAVGGAVGAGVRWVPAVAAGVGSAAAVGATPPGVPGVLPGVTGVVGATDVVVTTPGLPDATGDDSGGSDAAPGLGDGLEAGEPTGTSAGTLPPVPDEGGTPFRSAVIRTIVMSSPKPTPTAV